tara:strand:+ start:73 stop:183 length:111 start_codon:yes stop_codon:yes gene_type:complete
MAKVISKTKSNSWAKHLRKIGKRMFWKRQRQEKQKE